MIGIYKITNTINNKNYIGQSNDIKRRWKDERNAAFNISSASYNYPLSRAFRKYGLENFTFEVLEECSIADLNQRERYWIHYYNSFYQGYNQTLGGDSGRGGIQKPQVIGIINDLKTTSLKHSEIASKWNYSVEMVQGINTGRYWFSEFETYPLQTQIIKEWKCIECGAPISRGAERCQKCAQEKNRKVERPAKEVLYNKLVELQGNFTQAGKFYGVSDNAIRRWCVSYEIPSKSKDYKLLKETPIIPQTKITSPKKIAQLDLKTGEIIQIFESVMSAARAINKPDGSGHISGACRGSRNSAYGYKWKYLED